MSTNPLPTSDGHHDREDLRLLELAIRKGWAIKDEWMDKLPEVAARIAADPGKKDRERLRALEVLNTMRGANVAGLVELIKTRRLVNGESTENIDHRVKVLKDVSMDDL